MSPTQTHRSAHFNRLITIAAFSLSIAFGQGISFLRAKDISVADQQLSSIFSFAPGDFNGDGKTDFIVGISRHLVTTPPPTDFSAVLYLGNGDGTFKRIDLPVASMTSPSAGYQGHVIAADFNGDNKLDFLVTIYNQTRIFLGNGDGSFQEGIQALPEFPLAAADFTGDGKVDLLTSNRYIQDDQKCSGNGSFRVFPGNGDGTFRSPLRSEERRGGKEC